MPPPEPTTIPSVDLETIERRLGRLEANTNYVDDWIEWDDVRVLLAEVARLQTQVASMREVVKAAPWELRDVARAAEESLLCTCSVPFAGDCHRHAADFEEGFIAGYAHVKALLDATPQPQGDGQTREEAGR